MQATPKRTGSAERPCIGSGLATETHVWIYDSDDKDSMAGAYGHILQCVLVCSSACAANAPQRASQVFMADEHTGMHAPTHDDIQRWDGTVGGGMRGRTWDDGSLLLILLMDNNRWALYTQCPYGSIMVYHYVRIILCVWTCTPSVHGAADGGGAMFDSSQRRA